MKPAKSWICYFSPTGTSRRVAEAVGRGLNCTQTVENFIKTYVTYTAAGYTDGSRAKFEATRALTARGSEAYDDITASRFSFAQNIPCTVKSLDITSYDYFAHGEGMFSCKVDFTAEMKNFGQKPPLGNTALTRAVFHGIIFAERHVP